MCLVLISPLQRADISEEETAVVFSKSTERCQNYALCQQVL